MSDSRKNVDTGPPKTSDSSLIEVARLMCTARNPSTNSEGKSDNLLTPAEQSSAVLPHGYDDLLESSAASVAKGQKIQLVCSYSPDNISTYASIANQVCKLSNDKTHAKISDIDDSQHPLRMTLDERTLTWTVPNISDDASLPIANKLFSAAQQLNRTQKLSVTVSHTIIDLRVSGEYSRLLATLKEWLSPFSPTDDGTSQGSSSPSKDSGFRLTLPSKIRKTLPVRLTVIL